jgi:hypothetical protein
VKLEHRGTLVIPVPYLWRHLLEKVLKEEISA